MPPSIDQPINSRDKSLRGHASQFFVAGELCRRGIMAVVTMGNSPNTDILCSDVQGTHFVHIQVKTFVPGRSRTCSVGLKSEWNYGDSFFWVLAGIPTTGSTSAFIYYVIPAPVMAQTVSAGHRMWMESPGAKGQEHKDSKIRVVPLPPSPAAKRWGIAEYENRWDLIERKLLLFDQSAGREDDLALVP